MLKWLGKVFFFGVVAARNIGGPTSLNDWSLSRRRKKGTWILGITFFTALWILYVARSALNAAAETDRTQTRARHRCKIPSNFCRVCWGRCKTKTHFACMRARCMWKCAVTNAKNTPLNYSGRSKARNRLRSRGFTTAWLQISSTTSLSSSGTATPKAMHCHLRCLLQVMAHQSFVAHLRQPQQSNQSSPLNDCILIAKNWDRNHKSYNGACKAYST